MINWWRLQIAYHKIFTRTRFAHGCFDVTTLPLLEMWCVCVCAMGASLKQMLYVSRILWKTFSVSRLRMNVPERERETDKSAPNVKCYCILHKLSRTHNNMMWKSSVYITYEREDWSVLHFSAVWRWTWILWPCDSNVLDVMSMVGWLNNPSGEVLSIWFVCECVCVIFVSSNRGGNLKPTIRLQYKIKLINKWKRLII